MTKPNVIPVTSELRIKYDPELKYYFITVWINAPGGRLYFPRIVERLEAESLATQWGLQIVNDPRLIALNQLT